MISWCNAQLEANGKNKIAEAIWMDELYDHFAYVEPHHLRNVIEQNPRNNQSHDRWFLALQKQIDDSK